MSWANDQKRKPKNMIFRMEETINEGMPLTDEEHLNAKLQHNRYEDDLNDNAVSYEEYATRVQEEENESTE